MKEQDKLDLPLPPSRGKPRKAKSPTSTNVKPLRISIFVGEKTKAIIDSLCLIRKETTSQLLVSGLKRIIADLPKEDRELLSSIEQRRVLYDTLRKHNLLAPNLKPHTTEQLLSEPRQAVKRSKEPKTYEEYWDLADEHQVDEAEYVEQTRKEEAELVARAEKEMLAKILHKGRDLGAKQALRAKQLRKEEAEPAETDHNDRQNKH